VIDEDAVQHVEELVAGGAEDSPVGGQPLPGGKDFLGHDIERAQGRSPLLLGRVVALEYRPISPGGSIAGHLPLEPPVHALQETGAL